MRRRATSCNGLKFHTPNDPITKSEGMICTAFISTDWPDSHLVGKNPFNLAVNLCFGGPDYQTLQMTSQPVVTSMPVKGVGIPSVKKLSHETTANGLKLSWPAPSTGFVLQSSGNPASSDSWTNAPVSLSTDGGFYELAVDATNTTGFFRLKLN